jgi:hypothetical protein
MQLDLPLFVPIPAEVEEVAAFARWLYDAGDRWVPAREITAALDLSDRQIRHLAASSGGIVVSAPGCPGYKHIRHCDPEEVRAVASRLQHQAKLMADRAGDILSQHHRCSRI